MDIVTVQERSRTSKINDDDGNKKLVPFRSEAAVLHICLK